MLPRRPAIHYLCAHTYIIKNITMKQRIQNKNLARSGKTTVVMFVIQLFLLFDKTESGEPGEPGESGDSTDSTDSTDSMHSDILARSAKINISAVGTTLPILARRAVIFSAKRGPTELAEPTEPSDPTEPADSMRIKQNKLSLTRTTIKKFFFKLLFCCYSCLKSCEPTTLIDNSRAIHGNL